METLYSRRMNLIEDFEEKNTKNTIFKYKLFNKNKYRAIYIQLYSLHDT